MRKIQIVFAFFALAILALFVYQVANGHWAAVNWGMLAIAAAVCLLVFVNFVYIFTYSYALAALFNGLLLAVALPSPATALPAAAAILFGLRMALFTRARNASSSYADKVRGIEAGHRAMPIGVKISLWFMCTWLQTFHLMGIYYAGRQGELTPAIIAGAAIMTLGLVIETLADAQKQRAKQDNATQLAINGLYSRIRHPNFLGEILVQLGLMTVGIASVARWNEFAAVILAPGYIVLLMIAEAARVDGEQHKQRSGDTEYRNWFARTGALLPRW